MVVLHGNLERISIDSQHSSDKYDETICCEEELRRRRRLLRKPMNKRLSFH
jgi:hypothetical protein